MPSQAHNKIIYIPSIESLRCWICVFERQQAVKGLTHFSRRAFVREMEQFFARAFNIEFRFADTSEIYLPGYCWSDVDSRWISYWLQRDFSKEQCKCVDIRDLEKQRQIDTYLRCTISQQAARVRQLAQEHGHSGWERL
ncbi:MAG: hypothetical protein NPIRA01_09700 [Nitrospirales bacterium]|nr:MAG: hypothetical protein NPIRA01_09700 [Nitrospirales bacterium]